MFQPQATPFSSFAYGGSIPNNNAAGDYNFQSATANLGLNSGGPITFDEPIFSNVGSFGNLNQHINLPQRYNNVMDTPPVVDDLATQEALARGYQPDLKGPLMGNKKSSHAITEEYAKADPVYVAKTSRLPQTYSHYRPVLGDGNCGWRAIGFSYFEALQKIGSKDQVEEEIARMMSLTSFIETWCGHQEWIFEDMREEVLSLLRDLAATIHVAPQSDVDSLILQRFNDEEVSNAIIYYFRLLASAWLKANSVTYRDFIPDGLGVDNYSKDMLEPPNTEIEHLGMTLLIDVLMKPVGIAVEIVYLDRSEGTHVNSHLIQAEDDNGIPINPGGPIAHLLYRPGHYDILYKDRTASLSLRQHHIINSASTPTNLQIHRAAVISRAVEPSPMSNFGSFDLSAMASIPGMSMASLGSHSHHGLPSSYTSLSDYEPILTPAYSLDTSVSTSSVSPISAAPSHASSTPIFPATSLPIHTAPAPAPPPPPQQHPRNLKVTTTTTEIPPPNVGNQFRHSKYEYESDWNDPSAQTFQTSTFKNSHYNTAHYNNPNFQPEEWSPDDEERSHGPRRDSTRHKSTST